MTPQEKQLLEQTAKKLDVLIDIFSRMNYPDKFILRKELVIQDKLTLTNTSSLDLSSTQQLKIGGSGSTVGFYGVTPVAKPATIAAPSGGATVDTQSRAAISSIITTLQSLGLIS